jgi:two-component system NarL family sensor kinase
VSAAGRLLSRPGGVLAVIRLTTIPLFFAAERLVEHPRAGSGPFGALLAVAAVYAIGMLVLELRGRGAEPRWATSVLDLVFIAALVYTSGGPFSQLRFAFFVLPVGAALLLGPALTAAMSGACVLAYLLVVVSYPVHGGLPDPDPLRFELAQALFLLWMGAAATLLSLVLTRRSRDVEELARSRGRLVAQALAAEDTARRRLAEALHDDALQNLLAARQELGAGDAASLDLVREGLDQSVVQLRQAVFDLHPYLLEQSGLRAALDAITERAARRAGFAAEVAVDPAAEGVADQLVFSIARELVANAATHSHASRVRVAVERDRDAVALVVADDGVGIPPGALDIAPRAGHIGLASCAERAEAVGGTFAVGRGDDGRGSVVRVRLPAPLISAAARPAPSGPAAARPGARAGTS